MIGTAFEGTRRDMLDPGCELEVVEPLVRALEALRGGVPGRARHQQPAAPAWPSCSTGWAWQGPSTRCSPGRTSRTGCAGSCSATLGSDLRDRPWRLFSLGDHYCNDIAPAVEIGAAAGYIDRFGRADGPATAVAPVVEELLPAIHAWVADPQAAAVRAVR